MIRVNVNGSLLSDKKAVALLGITVDRKLFFELHLNEACKKSHSNIHTLGHPCYSFKTYFIEKTESYYESIYSRILDNKINFLKGCYLLLRTIGSPHLKNY